MQSESSLRISFAAWGIITCAILSSIAGAQGPIVDAPNVLAANHVGVAETNCGCRNVPGGFPCKSGCPKCMKGIDCQDHCGEEARWRDMCPMPFDAYGPGGYAGPSRYAHLGEYRLRPGDHVQVIYLITRRQEEGDYRLSPGDEVLIESVADPDLQRGTLDRGLVIQPDGTITVRLLGQIKAAGLTISQLRAALEQKYKKL